MAKLWWYTQTEEHLAGSAATREDAIQAGKDHFCGETFMICEGERFKYAVPSFDAWFAEAFDDANADYAGEDEYPSAAWDDAAYKTLVSEMEAVANKWIDANGYRDATAIDCGPYETIPETVEAGVDEIREKARG